MDIELLAYKVIEKIKALPEDAKQCTGEDSPKSVWDEYLEQVQYEENDSFLILRDTIRSMVNDEVSELSPGDLRTLYNSIYKDDNLADLEKMSQDVKDEILSYLHDEAESGEIEYNDTEIRFYKYYLDLSDFSIREIIDYDIVTICEVIKRVSPYDHLIHAYSNFTGPVGEQGVVNLSSLEEENGLERITFEEYKEIKLNLFGEDKGSNGEIKSEDAIKSKANNDRVTLYQYISQKIEIHIQAYFEGENLIILDYSIGENVEAYSGDIDEEHYLTIRQSEVQKIYNVLDLRDGDRNTLLTALSTKFNTNLCCTEFKAFLNEHGIKYEEDFW